ncbi:ORF 73 ECLF1 [hydrothermal vent metagenome]|uniref:ORF 73 ECLF1 n=1 Tax=hydrothermal vent metagenome TaxID=652676 RepID=A0A1W1EJ41_9ZZZZ
MINLPPLEIPALQLPMPVPELIHPAIVHFAIVLPIIIFLIEFFNTIFKKRALSITSLLLIVLLTIIAFGAYLTGSVDGENAYNLLSSDGQADLKEHKLLGIYIVYGSASLLLFKLISMIIKASFIRFLFILLLIGFTGATLYQGKEGGELVYKYGSNIAPVADLGEEVSDLKEEMEESDEENKAKIKSLEDKIATLEKSAKDGGSLKSINDELKAQLDTLKTKAQDTQKDLERQIEILKKRGEETKASLKGEITTIKDKASKIVEAVTTDDSNEANVSVE